MNPYSHDNHGLPFSTNNFFLVGLPELQQHQHPQYNQQQQLQQQQQSQRNSVPVPNPHIHASNILSSPTFVGLFEKQGQETDQLINIQNGQIKVMLQHHIRELQVATLKNMEIYSRQIMTKANEEIAKVVKKNQEMENLLRSLETEKRFLKRIAEERGATAIALHNKLEEEKKRARMVVLNDAESCCGESEEARAEKRMRSDDSLKFCSKCKTNFVGVLFLPCRHLSLCKQCEALLQTCPICGMAKKDVIEIQSSISY